MCWQIGLLIAASQRLPGELRLICPCVCREEVLMSLSALFESLVALLGLVSAVYLVYAYFVFLKSVIHVHRHAHSHPPL